METCQPLLTAGCSSKHFHSHHALHAVLQSLTIWHAGQHAGMQCMGHWLTLSLYFWWSFLLDTNLIHNDIIIVNPRLLFSFMRACYFRMCLKGRSVTPQIFSHTHLPWQWCTSLQCFYWPQVRIALLKVHLYRQSLQCKMHFNWIKGSF